MSNLDLSRAQILGLVNTTLGSFILDAGRADLLKEMVETGVWIALSTVQ